MSDTELKDESSKLKELQHLDTIIRRIAEIDDVNKNQDFEYLNGYLIAPPDKNGKLICWRSFNNFYKDLFAKLPDSDDSSQTKNAEVLNSKSLEDSSNKNLDTKKDSENLEFQPKIRIRSNTLSKKDHQKVYLILEKIYKDLMNFIKEGKKEEINDKDKKMEQTQYRSSIDLAFEKIKSTISENEARDKRKPEKSEKKNTNREPLNKSEKEIPDKKPDNEKTKLVASVEKKLGEIQEILTGTQIKSEDKELSKSKALDQKNGSDIYKNKINSEKTNQNEYSKKKDPPGDKKYKKLNSNNQSIKSKILSSSSNSSNSEDDLDLDSGEKINKLKDTRMEESDSESTLTYTSFKSNNRSKSYRNSDKNSRNKEKNKLNKISDLTEKIIEKTNDKFMNTDQRNKVKQEQTNKPAPKMSKSTDMTTNFINGLNRKTKKIRA
jgi:hypothetical protein